MYTEIVPDIYDVTVTHSKGRRYRAYLSLESVPTLVDTGYEETADTLFEAIESIGTEPERVIVTHGDGDHIDGLDAVVDRYDVETWVPNETDTSEYVDPDNRYGDGDTIGRFEAVYTPGHEPDHYALVDEDAGILITGDAMWGADLRGLPAGYLIPPPALHSENVNEAEASLEKLLEYDFETALVFHGSSVIGTAYERLDRLVNIPGRPDEPTY